METIEVGCAIIIKAKRLLIAQRKATDTYGGFWEFPGGKRETFETIEECLVREVREELGIKIRPIEPFVRHDCVYPERTIALFFHLCEWVSGEPESIDCQAVRWVSAADLKSLKFPPGDTDVLARLVIDKRMC